MAGAGGAAGRGRGRCSGTRRSPICSIRPRPSSTSCRIRSGRRSRSRCCAPGLGTRCRPRRWRSAPPRSCARLASRAAARRGRRRAVARPVRRSRCSRYALRRLAPERRGRGDDRAELRAARCRSGSTGSTATERIDVGPAQPRRAAPPAARPPRPRVQPADARAPPGGVARATRCSRSSSAGRCCARVRTRGRAVRCPVPESLRDLIADRLDTVSADGPPGAASRSRRRPSPTVEVVEAIVDLDALGEAETARLVEDAQRSGGLGPSARWPRPATRRPPPPSAARCTRRSPDLARDVEERARHLALSAAAGDHDVATTLHDAANQAAERGANDSAVDLARLAVDHTADDDPERWVTAPPARRSALPHRRQLGRGGDARAGAGRRGRPAHQGPGAVPARPGRVGDGHRRGGARRWSREGFALLEPGDPPELLAELHTTMAGVLLNDLQAERDPQRGGPRAAVLDARSGSAAARRRRWSRRRRPTS